MAFNNISYLQKLLCGLTSFIDSKKSSVNSSFILVFGFINDLDKLKNCGFLSVSKKLMPRELNLLARWTTNPINDSIIEPSSWLTTLGDWDVF